MKPDFSRCAIAVAAILLSWNASVLAQSGEVLGNDIRGKTVCGYQGWFRTPNPAAPYGWRHYAGRGEFAPGNAAIDLWPAVHELPESSRVATSFRHRDGSTAHVFNSHDPNVVAMHFRWMQEYGIDGIMLQRFPSDTGDKSFRKTMDDILTYCDKSSAESKRSWALMYDLSGIQAGHIDRVLDDWRHLVDEGLVSRSKENYWQFDGKPLVALWGCGFNDRDPMLDEWDRMIRFMQTDPVYGGNAVMLGVPYYWLELKRDSITDLKLHQLISSVQIVSPWSVGRYGPREGLLGDNAKHLKRDLAWCDRQGVGYMPVIFPGFSWHNLSKQRNVDAKLNQIPRQGGQFLWDQAIAAKNAGCNSLYVAMFDELDEGTAIMKTDPNPPIGDTPFVAEKDLPSDHYLWLTGRIAQRMKKENSASQELPRRSK